MVLFLSVLALLFILLVLIVKCLSTNTISKESTAPVTAEEFINDATGVDLFPTDKMN